MNLLKPKIRRYESLPSTNNEVARLAALGAEEGLAVIAEEQTAGRGRLQRVWISPKGAGLYFSILLRPEISVDRWPLITFIAALSVSDALLEACGLAQTSSGPTIFLQVKEKSAAYLPK
jgi:BirA family biotin operon repressor/biotin-[acetyl-CoA-carboxylase] ligase